MSEEGSRSNPSPSHQDSALAGDTTEILADLRSVHPDHPDQTPILEGLSFRKERRDESLGAYQTNFLDAVQKILSNRQREASERGTWEHGVTEPWKFQSARHTPPPSPSGSPRTPPLRSPSSPAKGKKTSEELVEDFKARLLQDLSFALEADLFAGHDDALRKLEQVGVVLPENYKPSPNASSEKPSPRRRAMDPRPRSASLPPSSPPIEPSVTPPPRTASPPADPTEAAAANKAAEDARRQAEEAARRRKAEEDRRKAAEAERKRRETEEAERRRKEDADKAQRARREQEAERRRAEETARKAAEAARKQRELDKSKSTPPAPKPASLPIAAAEDGEGLKYFIQACEAQAYSIKERKPDHASAIINDGSDKGEIHYEEQDSVPPRLYTEGSLSNPFQNMALILVRMMLLQNKNVATIYLSEDVYTDHFIPAFKQAKEDLAATGLKTADLEAENRPEGPSSAPRMST